MIAAIELKKRVAGICIFSVIIRKFRPTQGPGPIVLLAIVKSTQINFYRSILLFGFAVRLQIECSQKLLLNAKKMV